MVYDFKSVDKVHVDMDERNESMICKCYKDGKVLKEENIVGDYNPFQIYSFLKVMYNSSAEISIGNSESKLEEDLDFEEELDDSELLGFCQH